MSSIDLVESKDAAIFYIYRSFELDHAVIGSIPSFPFAQTRVSLDVLNEIAFAGVIEAAYCRHVEKLNVILKAHPKEAVIRVASKKLVYFLGGLCLCVSL